MVQNESVLIRNTTRPQREKIVKEVRAITSSCGVGSGKKGADYFQLYIDGTREIEELFDLYLSDMSSKIRK